LEEHAKIVHFLRLDPSLTQHYGVWIIDCAPCQGYNVCTIIAPYEY